MRRANASRLVGLVLVLGVLPMVVMRCDLGRPGEAPSSTPPAVALPRADWPLEGDSWIYDGAWVAPDELVLVDALNNRLLAFDRGGRYEGEGLGWLRRGVADEGFYPSRLATIGETITLGLAGGLVVETEGERVVKVHRLLEVEVRGGELVGVYAWAAGSRDLVVVGQLREGNSRGPLRLFAVPWDGTEASWIGPPVPGTAEGSGAASWYALGDARLARLGRFVFLLTYDPGTGRTEILRGEVGSDRLVPLGAWPEVPRHLSWPLGYETVDGFVGMSTLVASAPGAVALLAWEEDLYLLARRPGPERTEWLLSRIDPRTEVVVGTVRLPSSSRHLVAVPGPKAWALIEKGPVTGFGDQRIEGLRMVPAEAVRAIGSRTLEESP